MNIYIGVDRNKCVPGCTCGRHKKRICPVDCKCSRIHPDPTPWQCKYCLNKDVIDVYYKEPPNRRQVRSYCKRCKMARAHSIPWEIYYKWLLAGCRICGRTDGRLEVDHDHTCCSEDYTCDKCYRGLLCSRHNTMVGILEDPYIVDALIYLKSTTPAASIFKEITL